MTPKERDELNAAAARLDGWEHGEAEDGYKYWGSPDSGEMRISPPDYLNDPRLWAPILERLVKVEAYPFYSKSLNKWVSPYEDVAHADTLAEAVLRLFVALEGRV